MWKRFSFFLAFLVLTGIVVHYFFTRTEVQVRAIYHLPVEQKSLEGTPENPQARVDYFNRMLVDPNTGVIPQNIRAKELEYSITLPTTKNVPGARTLQINNWRSRGPSNVGGRTRGAAIDVNDENTLIAGGVSGGIWRTTSSGTQWDRITEPGSLHSVSCLVQDPRGGKTNIWYYGTGELNGNTARGGGAPFRGDGIFKSVNGGISWSPVISTATNNPGTFDSQFNYVWNLAIDPSDLNDDVIYAAIYGAIARSMNGGQSWEIVLGGDFGTGGDINTRIASRETDVVVTPDGVVYATLSSFTGASGELSPNAGIYRSTDQGDTWENITPEGWPVFYRRTVMGFSRNAPRVLYFLVDDAEDGGIWQLTDIPFFGTTEWENRSQNIPKFGGSVGDFDTQGSYNMVISVHPEDLNTVFIGATNIYRSTDGFRTRSNTDWIGGYDTDNDNSIYPGSHPDQHSMHFYVSNPDRVLSSHDGGLSITENILADSVIWTKINTGYLTSQFYTVAMDRTSTNDLVFGGLQDNGTYLTLNDNPEAPWGRIIGGDGAYGAVSRDGFYYYVSFQESQIFRLTFDENFGLTSFARVDPSGGGQTEGQEYLFINPYLLDPNNTNVMYLAGGDRLWRNVNVSQIPSGFNSTTSINWEDLDGTRLRSGVVTAIEASTYPRDIVYFGTSNRRIFRIDSASAPGYNVVEISDAIEFEEGGYVSSIAVDPSNAANVMVVFSNYGIKSLYYSTDYGNSFISVSGDLEEFPDGTGNGPSTRWAEIIPLTNNEYIYLVGTSTGLYSTSELDGENTLWAQESPDEIGNKVVMMITYRSTDGKILVATHGSGIYEASLNNTLPVEGNPGKEILSFGSPYPNPFQEIVYIPYSVPENEIVLIEIYNTLGQPVRTLFLGTHLSGENTVSWDGTNDGGVRVPDGVYICNITTGNTTKGTRVVLSRTQ